MKYISFDWRKPKAPLTENEQVEKYKAKSKSWKKASSRIGWITYISVLGTAAIIGSNTLSIKSMYKPESVRISQRMDSALESIHDSSAWANGIGIYSGLNDSETNKQRQEYVTLSSELESKLSDQIAALDATSASKEYYGHLENRLKATGILSPLLLLLLSGGLLGWTTTGMVADKYKNKASAIENKLRAEEMEAERIAREARYAAEIQAARSEREQRKGRLENGVFN